MVTAMRSQILVASKLNRLLTPYWTLVITAPSVSKCIVILVIMKVASYYALLLPLNFDIFFRSKVISKMLNFRSPVR